jgi:flagellar motility protein MotE (MotC chaperone)
MNRILSSPLTIVLTGGLMFFLTMFITLSLVHFGPVQPSAATPLAADDNPSWKFRNPEFEQWVSQIKDERAALALREEQLKDWEMRLTAENREISTVTQTVTKLQNEFDRRVLQFKEQEVANAKKQVKVIADMSPEGAAAMLNELQDDETTKLLYLMKADVSGPILDAMSKLGTTQAKRAASITQRLKEVLPISATNSLSSNATP